MPELGAKGLADRLADLEYYPEIYTYPTPRMYEPLPGFSPHGLELTSTLNVYIHVPFCKQFCTFCGYFKTIYEEGLQEQFVEAVMREVELRAEALQGRSVETLHFGGGTPSLLTAAQLSRLVEALQRANPELLESCREISIEATPESVEPVKFAGYCRAGIQRVSLGVQSLVDEEVRLANRCLTSQESARDMLARAVDILRGLGIESIVIDLMIGIEGQTRQSFETSLVRTLELRPQTVQLYALGLMPQTGLGRRRPTQLMPGHEIYACYELARQLFEAAGYRRESHDRYSLHPLNGFLQGDGNIRGVSLVGLGAGARSYAPTVHFRNVFSGNNGRKALETYLAHMASGQLAVESGCYLDADEQMRQYAIGHLMNLNEDDFCQRFGVHFQQRFADLFQQMVDLELMVVEGPWLRLNERGLLFRDLLGRQLFSEKARQLEEAYRS